MITGSVSRFRAYIELVVVGPDGRKANVEFVVDTGFTASLTLPPDACEALNLTFLRSEPAGLADGSRVMLEVYEALVVWDGEERSVEVLAAGSAPLVGMTSLDGCEVCFQVAENGLLTIEAL